MQVSGQLPDPAALHQGNKSGTHWVGEWVGLTAELCNSGRKKIFCRCWDSNTGLSTPFPVAIRYITHKNNTLKDWTEGNLHNLNVDIKMVLHSNLNRACRLDEGVAGLYQQSPLHFAWGPLARVSQSLRPSCLSHVVATTIYTKEYWHVHRSDFRNTLIYTRAHDIAHSPDLWHNTRLTNVTCA